MKPYVYGRGDDTVALVGDLVQSTIFGNVPVRVVDLGVQARVESCDKALDDFLTALKGFGAGVKMSTASDDPAILAAVGRGDLRKKSANIVLRPKAGVVGMFRMIPSPQCYAKPVAVFRYGSGGFYEEQSCEVLGDEIVYTTRMNIANLKPFAELAMKLADRHGLVLRASSKWTIAQSEALFIDGITSVWDEAGVNYKRILTDVALATIATDREGGWLWLLDNPNGDSGSDIADWVDGSRSMGSTLYCADGSSYEELPGGTAPDKLGTDLTGSNFFNPLGVIFAFASAIEMANPEMAKWLGKIRALALKYLELIDENERDTHKMLGFIHLAADNAAAYQTAMEMTKPAA